MISIWNTVNDVALRSGQVGMWLIIPIMLAIVVEIIARVIFNVSFTGLYEAVEFMLVAFTFLGLARSYKAGAHVTVSLLTEKMSPRWRDITGRFVALIGAIAWLCIGWRSFVHGETLRTSNLLSPTINVPIYPLIYLVAASSLLLGVVLLGEIFRNKNQDTVS